MRLSTPFFIALLLIASVAQSSAQFISKKEVAKIDALCSTVSEAHQPKTYLFKKVYTLTMLNAELVEQDVLIENGLIKEIGSHISRQGAIEIDGRGKYLMPGLADMHVHLFHGDYTKNTWLLLLLMNGVTSVRDMAGEPEKLLLRDQIRKNELLAPNLYQAGPILDGKNPGAAKVILDTPDEAKKEVRRQKEAGYDFIKVYNDLSTAVYWAILEEAHSLKIPVVGHIPDAITVEEALGKQHSIEHFTGYKEWSGDSSYLNVAENYAVQTATSSTWNCPTFYNQYMNWEGLAVANKIVAEQSDYVPAKLKSRWKKALSKNRAEKELLLKKYAAQNQQLLRELTLNLYKAHAKLIAGTDASGNSLNIPGFSMRRELIALNQLGIPVFEVLKMATVNAGLAIQENSEFGTIEVGKRADLLLLDRNPLASITHLNMKAGVMVRGIWLSRSEFDLIGKEIKSIFGND